MSGDLPRAVALDRNLTLPPRVERVRRMAVLRANGLGDYITCEPALAALRAAYPDAEITLLGARHHRPLVVDRPGPCDRFVEVPLMPGVRAGSGPDASAPEVEAFLAAHREVGYDLAVQLHGGGRHSNPLVAALGARVTAGPATRDAIPLDRSIPYVANQHEILRWLDVAAACGADAVRRAPRLALIDTDRQEAEQVLTGAGVRPDRRIVALHPGATDARRRWPVDRHVAVASALPGAQVVLLGGPGEREFVDEARRSAARRGVPTADLCGALGLGGLLGVLARADLFLGNDSGPRHLAEAVGTPTVAVFTNANLADVAPLSRVWHRVALSWASRCAVCGTPVQASCDHDATALADVGVEEVRELAEDLWAQAEPGRVVPLERRLTA